MINILAASDFLVGAYYILWLGVASIDYGFPTSGIDYEHSLQYMKSMAVKGLRRQTCIPLTAYYNKLPIRGSRITPP